MADDDFSSAGADDIPMTAKAPAARPPFEVPPLVPDNAETRRLLGGRPIPMRVGRAKAAAAPVAGEVLAMPAPALGKLSGTFSGAAAGDPVLTQAVGAAREILGRIIVLIADAERVMPGLLDAIGKQPGAAMSQENFDVTEAGSFFDGLMVALEAIRK